MKTKPLAGITIMDFGWVLAGPHGGRLLCDLGATVIKVESATRPDTFRIDTRRAGVTDFFQEGGWSFHDQARGKMSLSLNLKSEKAKEVLGRLIEKTDVVISNLSAKGPASMGIEYETLRKIKDDIITINMPSMGDSGPYSKYLAFAPIMQALSGLTSMIGYDGEDPCGFSGVVADTVGGASLAMAVVGAIEYRRRTGKGQRIDMSSTETTLALLDTAFLDYQITGHITTPFGNHHYLREMAPHNCYPCAGDDEWCVIAAGSDEEWNNFKNVLKADCPRAEDEKFSTLQGRLENQDELDGMISEWTRKQNKKELCLRLQSAGVSAGMVQNARDLTNDEHAIATGYMKTLDFGEGPCEPRYLKITGPIYNITSIPTPEYKPGPSLGQDNEYILKQMFQMTDVQIQEAVEDKAFI